MARSSSNPFARLETAETPDEPALVPETPEVPPEGLAAYHEAFPALWRYRTRAGTGPFPAHDPEATGLQAYPPVRFALRRIHDTRHGVLINFRGITGASPEALEFWGDLSGIYDSAAARFTGLGRNAEGKITLPPTMPEWTAFQALYRQAQARAEAVLRTQGTNAKLMDAWARAAAEAIEARVEIGGILSAVRKYKDPETGYSWDHVVAAKSDAALVDRVVGAETIWKESLARRHQTYTLPSLDMAPAEDVAPPVIKNLCPAGGALLIVTSSSTEAADLIASRLYGVSYHDHEVTAGPAVLIDGVSSRARLTNAWADQVNDGADLTVIPHRHLPLDVRNRDVQDTLIDGLPTGALIVINDTSLMAAAGVSEMTTEAGAWMAGWERVAEATDAEGLVIFHGPIKNNPRQGRGHVLLSSWGDVQASIASGSLYYPGLEATRAPSAAERVLELVKESPGLSHGQIARRLSVSPNTVTKVSDELLEAGKIERREGERRAKILFPTV